MFKKVTKQEQIRNTRQEGLSRHVKQNEDVNEVATTSAIVLEDSVMTGETVGQLLLKISELEDRILALEVGK